MEVTMPVYSIGAEEAENGLYRAALYNPITHELKRLSDRRMGYGEAFELAYRMSIGEA
jgi:hypothetical protein